MRTAFTTLHSLIIGKRPFNTIFSFNYHNIRPIVRFLTEVTKQYDLRGQVLLDVGAGSSPYYELFAEYLSDYIVVDMESILPKEESRPIVQKVGVAEELPIEDGSIDIVMSNQVLEHVLDERKAVEESFRVLKPGGLFIGSVPHASPIHLEPYDFRRFTVYGLQKLFTDAGFEIKRIEGNGGVHRALAMCLMMDWYLSKHKEGEQQRFRSVLHLALFPINGLINTLAILGDFLFGDKKRTPSNYCWVAIKKS